MKTTVLLAALLSFSSLSFAQTNCTKYLGGEITCDGPNGYRMEAREHLNGQTSFYDSRGNVGTVTQTLNGGVNVSPTVVGRGGPPTPGTGLSLSRAGNGLESISPPSINSEQARDAIRGYGDSQQPIPDYSSLPKTPEEYRLSVLWMKAVGEKDFEKAQELKQLLWQEQFANANATGKVRMFNQERAERRQEMMGVFDRAEKRIRWENRPAKLATFHKFKEGALTSYDKQEAEADQVFYEKLQEWKEEKESNDRLAKFEADLVSLRALELEPLEYQKKEDELLEQWGKAEDEQKQRITVALNARLDRLIAEEAIQHKVKNKKVTAR